MAINPADITTVRVGQLPPDLPTLESNIAHELGDILYKCTIQELVDLLSLNVGTLQYEVKTLYVNQEYIDNNFDETGLGTNLMLGYAICNGDNGTPPMDGLVSVGYGTNYNVIGGFGGSKDAVVVAHTHGQRTSSGNGFDLPQIKISGGGTTTGVAGDTSSAGTRMQVMTDETGIDGTNKNMQPYIIALKIMKL
jgi:hypothetical protein